MHLLIAEFKKMHKISIFSPSNDQKMKCVKKHKCYNEEVFSLLQYLFIDKCSLPDEKKEKKKFPRARATFALTSKSLPLLFLSPSFDSHSCVSILSLIFSIVFLIYHTLKIPNNIIFYI